MAHKNMMGAYAKAALVFAVLVTPNLSLSDESASSVIADEEYMRMDHNPEPDTGTDLFYFVHQSKAASLVPHTYVELNYEDLIMSEVFRKARYGAERRIIYLEYWKRERHPAPEDLMVDGAPVNAFPASRIGQDVKNQTPLFYMLNPETEAYEQVDYAQTEGETEFLRLRLRNRVMNDELFVSAELIQQRLQSKRAYTYTADGALSKIVEWARRNDFRRVEAVYDR